MKNVELPDDVFEMLESFARSRGLSLAEAVQVAVGEAATIANGPAHVEMDDETRAWMDSDLSRLGEHEPYDWGDFNPLTAGEPVIYKKGVGLVVLEDSETSYMAAEQSVSGGFRPYVESEKR